MSTDVESLNACTLLVGGQMFGGWERIEIQSSIEQIASAFALDVTLRWPGQDVPVGIREGLPCTVRLGDDVVVTGYIDEYEADCDSSTSKLRIQGRDRTGDLVDSSAIHKTGQWRGVPLQRIVSDIAAPFGITVAVDAGVDTGAAIKSFALEDGEKAFDAIDRAARMRSVLVTSTPDGNLLLTRASAAHSGVELVEGINLLRFTATHSWRERHSQVILKGQTPGDDDTNGAAAALQKQTATDAEIDRYRPLIVMAEQGTSAAALADRAKWETRIRMGRGKRGRATVVGWRTGEDGQTGPLWRKNTLVRITSERMNLDMDMLIVGCNYQFSEQGRLTELVFARPEAFELVDGVGRSQLGRKITDKTDRTKKRKDGEGFEPSWQLTPPNPRSRTPRASE